MSVACPSATVANVPDRVRGGAGPNSCDPHVAPRARAALTSASARLERVCEGELAAVPEESAGGAKLVCGGARGADAGEEASTSQVSEPRRYTPTSRRSRPATA